MESSRQPLSEEYLRTHTVGELEPLSGPIRLAEYDPAWPLRFAQEAGKIRAALGGRVLRLEHVVEEIMARAR